MSQVIVQIDAFTDKPFSGNPAAVCLLEKAADENWMQAVAMEMNLSETAFLFPADDGYDIRWFTPAVEVNLCGHATLASAYLLYIDGHSDKSETITFYSKSGILRTRFNHGWVTLDFPIKEPREIEIPDGLVEALGATPIAIRSNEEDCLCEFETEDTVRKLIPDFGKLKKLPFRGIVVTSKSDGQFDFISRFFAPACGIDEDPVTGSSFCLLAPYWTKKLGKDDLTAFQASPRGGHIGIRIEGERVFISGQAVITMRGELF